MGQSLVMTRAILVGPTWGHYTAGRLESNQRLDLEFDLGSTPKKSAGRVFDGSLILRLGLSGSSLLTSSCQGSCRVECTGPPLHTPPTEMADPTRPVARLGGRSEWGGSPEGRFHGISQKGDTDGSAQNNQKTAKNQHEILQKSA